ncbi:MAG: recombinase RecT, partial [Limosilactobacillus sp.]|uniref:recombinase RecT n=1 Tax=Limosilactobacillus sp. TaxID=2773925 RepID=UPI0023BFAD9A
GKGKDNPKGVWAKHYDSMALKTVLKDLITKWGPMTVDTQTANLAETGDYEQVVKEDPRDVTPEQTEDNAQVQSLINSYNEAQEEQQTTKKATKPAKTKKTATKGGKVDDNNVQEELLNDGTITPDTK